MIYLFVMFVIVSSIDDSLYKKSTRLPSLNRRNNLP
jgi:hypothetical protein